MYNDPRYGVIINQKKSQQKYFSCCLNLFSYGKSFYLVEVI